MANYFKSTFKNFGLIRLIVTALLFSLLSIPLSYVLKENAYYENLYEMAFYLPICILLLATCAGAIKVTNDKIDFYDSIRFIGIISSIVTFIISLCMIGYNSLTCVLSIGTIVLDVAEIIARSKVKNVSYDTTECGPRSFYKLVYKPGLLCSITVGLLSGILVSLCLQDITIINKYFYVWILGFIGYLLVYFAISFFVNKKYFLDDITFMVLGFGISFFYNNINIYTDLQNLAVIVVLIGSVVGLSFRVCLTKENDIVRYPNYYGYLGNSNNLGIAHTLGILAFVSICGKSLLNILNRALELNLNLDNFEFKEVSYFVLAIAVISLIVFVSFLVKCKLKSGKEITRTDRSLYSLVLIGLLISLYSVYDLYTGGFKFDQISLSNYILYSTGYIDLALGLLFSCIRIENFNKAELEEEQDTNEDVIDDALNTIGSNEEKEEEPNEEIDESKEEQAPEEVEEPEEVTIDEETTEEDTSSEEETDDEFEQFINTLSEKEENPSSEQETIEEAKGEPKEEALSEDTPNEAEEETEDDEDESLESDESEDDEEETLEKEEEEVNPTANVEVKAIETYDSEGNKKVIKKKFTTKMMFAPYETKQYYSEVKNYLTMYRCKARSTSACESFRYKGLIAKLAILGKTLKVYLALDPSEFEGSKYHVKDASDKRRYAEVPCLLKVKSDRSLKYCKELIDLIMERKEVKPKRNFEEVDYTSELIPNGEAILTSIGFASDYISDNVSMKSSFVHDLPDDLENYIPVVQGEPLDEDEIQVTVCLDTLCNHFNDGDAVSLDILKSMGLIATGNTLRIKARGTMDKKLTIYADIFDPLALKMLMCRNCTAVKIER